ncbi:hypothetical protein QN277_003912 [Acacia crassicarpa]|uniref:Uncharacterized protein n=1 Tax=Acacia crassicarpa TaxID=499986 RepID=A0AAE1J2K4_9FABA|nr:hypothetical protein QN277_003912 [Acacia crassicarpa]
MKRQRLVSVSGFEAAEIAATTAKKKKQPNQKAVAVLRKNTEEEEKELKKREGKKMEVMVAMGAQENVSGFANNWDDENWAWIGHFVDEQMSWGSVWFPFWDIDFSGDAFGAFYGDVVWDDDIWNLKEEIPNPFQR